MAAGDGGEYRGEGAGRAAREEEAGGDGAEGEGGAEEGWGGQGRGHTAVVGAGERGLDRLRSGSWVDGQTGCILL